MSTIKEQGEARGGVVTGDGATWALNAPRITERRLREDVQSVVTWAIELGHADVGPDGGPPSIDDLEAGHDAVGAVLRSALEAVRNGTAADGPARRGAVDLVLACRDVEARLRDAERAAESVALGSVREALGTLRDVATVEQLLERAPTAAVRLGFDRALVSAIERSVLAPRSCLMGGDVERTEAMIRVGREQPRRLDPSLPETEIVRRRRAIIVRDAWNCPDAHRPLVEVSETRDYAAAPIMGGGRVIGMLHADHFEKRRRVSRFDRDLLWMFADAFGQTFERVALDARVEGIRQAVGRASALTDAAIGRTTGEELVLGGGPDVDADVAPTVRAAPVPTPTRAPVLPAEDRIDAVLTPREVQVLRLMAEGETNTGIAERLIVAPGTAKTHVKHILRKLCASNRAEAVSRYLQLEHERAAAGHARGW
ncbi:MAG: LuxR C-terminal-related transcriptional regulator [Solirubrobacteraceae bacterium]|nr:LuxR C-terminal-related transcriptional regulator [Solirubrobacteraceae bacterium]